jgi:hypothetical protein
MGLDPKVFVVVLEVVDVSGLAMESVDGFRGWPDGRCGGCWGWCRGGLMLGGLSST